MIFHCDFNLHVHFLGDIILYTENPKDFTKNLLELINESSKVAGYKINIQKSVMFLYTNSELSERKTKKTIPFTIGNTKEKVPRNKFNQGGKRLGKEVFLENYKTLKKEIEEDTNKWKHILCSWTGRINLIKMSILSKANCRIIAIPIDTNDIFHRTKTNIPKICMKSQKTPDSNSNF